MRRCLLASSLFAGSLAVTLAAGCGGDDPVAVDAAAPDATIIDATVPPDGPPDRFACLGDPLPTVAADPIDVGGETSEVGAGGATPLAGVVVTLFSAGDAVLGNDTSDAQGLYSVNLATGGTPLDGYLRATAAGYLDTYLYPPAPLAASTDAARAIMVTPGTFSLLANLAGVKPAKGAGNVLVIVLDCDDAPVQGAVVTASPAGTVRYNSGTFPSDTATSTAADGIAYILNVAPGTVTVDATVNGMSLREHDVVARSGTLTTTIVGP